MKKVVFISAIISLSLTSCKKDYTCVCTASFLGTTVSATTMAHSTKKGATNWCKSLESPTETVDGAPSANSFPLTCEIK